MKLFECSWRDGFDYFTRYYNTDLKQSLKEKIDGNFEYFIQDPKGSYTYLLDSNIRLSKQRGSRKNGLNEYGLTDPVYRNIRDNFWKSKQFNQNPRIWYLDIETRTNTVSRGFPDSNEALEPVSLIQFFDSHLNTMIILGLKDFELREDYKLEYPVKYIKCASEAEMFNNFNKIFNKLDPLVIYAWNGDNFDFPYLYNRAKNLGLDIFSNYGKTTYDKKIRSCGHVFFDMIDVYKMIILAPRTSYSLDNISKVELNDNKIEHTEFNDFDSFYTGKNYTIAEEPYSDTVREEIRQLYIRKSKGEDVQKELDKLISFQFVYYGIYDVYLLKRLDDKLKLTSILNGMASLMGVQLSDTLGTVKKWSIYISNVIYEKGIVAPPEQEHNLPNIKGAVVKDPIVGKHRWVLSADVDSMYPLLAIVAFNMSPETYVPVHKLPTDLRELVLKYYQGQDEDLVLNLPKEVQEETKRLLKKYNFTLAINGAVFRTDKVGILPQLVSDIYDERKKAKKTMLTYKKIKAQIESLTSFGNLSEIRDPLEYSESEIQNLSKSITDELIKICAEKAQDFDVHQHVLKILINSLYGALGKQQFLFFNEKIAQAITGNGRYFIKSLGSNTNNYLKSLDERFKDIEFWIYTDTDSCYFQIAPFVDDFVSKNSNATLKECLDFALDFEKEHIEKMIRYTIDEFAEKFNAFNRSRIGAKIEICADSAIFITKKRYIARVRYDEGTIYPFDHPKLKVMGLEIVRSSTPDWCKKKLKEAIPLMLDKTENELKNWVKEVKQEYTKQPLQDISINGGASSLDYDLNGKGVPIASRACLVHNKYINDNNLVDRFAEIREGDKFKRIYLQEPNIFRSNIVGYQSSQFAELIKCVDYDMNFEKTFIKPLEIMTNALKYNLRNDCEDILYW